MMKPRRIRELVFQQLRQYRDTKRMLAEYETLGLKARPIGASRPAGGHGDPTAADALRLLEPDEDIKRMQGWVWAIEQALSLLEREAPHKAQLMELLFFADTGDTPSDSCRRREDLAEELHVSEATLYRWRDDIMQLVMAAAIEAGVLSPCGRPRSAREKGTPVSQT